MTVHITYFPHGTTTDNENDISSGWSDVELSDLGIKQSIKLKDLIKDQRFDVVFCSDLKRAVESAKLTWGESLPQVLDKRLRECNYGDFNANFTSIVDPMKKQHIYEPFPGGESYEDVKKRLEEFIVFLKENYDGKRVAIVAHQAPQLALDVILKGKTWEQAFAEDWRNTKGWQPGWQYEIE